MKVLHLPWTYYPDPVGGTEVYVRHLAEALQKRGVQCAIAAPGAHDCTYEHDSLTVYRFAGSNSGDLLAQYGRGDAIAAQRFSHILDTAAPDIVHLHSFSSAVSRLILSETHSQSIPIVFTYHTPAITCLRGSLLRWGTQVCDGVMRVTECTACVLHSLGLPRAAAEGLARVPPFVGASALKSPTASRGITALRMSGLVRTHHDAVAELVRNSDAVVALSDWTRELLIRNGADPQKISMSRHGIPWTESGSRVHSSTDLPVRLAYVGRLDPVKGVDVLIRALLFDRELPVQLDVLGVVQTGAGARHARDIEHLAQADKRIRFLEPVPSEQVVGVLQKYDAVLVPSQCLETGPLVVLEAFAAGIPVVGSALGGIAELVRDNCDGLLVDPPSDPAAWASVLRRLVADRDTLPHLRASIRPPRSVADVASDMHLLYSRLTAGSLTTG